MNREEVREKIRRMIAEVVGSEIDNLGDEASLMDEVGLSSLEVMTMLADVEAEFDVSLDEDRVSEVETIDELVDLIVETQE